MSSPNRDSWVDEARREVESALAAQADPGKAARMQAYMKTEMPVYGVQKPERQPILRQLVETYPPGSAADYEPMVLGLWNLPHREEKYLALGYARRFKKYVTPDRLPLYRRLIVEGAWWDFVDEVATHLIHSLVIDHPDESWPTVDRWIDDEVMWLRRTALICQVGAKEATDAERLYRFARDRAPEKEFFIRKAIGWALREYSKTDPEGVAGFINSNLETLSGLSYREGSRHIRDLVDPR